MQKDMTQHIIQNPIIPGFYPDPSICRAEDDFYLVCSSFELYPGIPVFHSKDLAHWEQIACAMTMDNGFHVKADMGNGGIMAPTIRYRDGQFYIICCNFADRGTFYVTAEDPAGPWSEPNWIEDIPDLDCSLFFDRDGKTWIVYPGNDENEDNHRGIFLSEYDLDHKRVCSEPKKIWNSALRKAWAPEAPHIYYIGEYYYLMIAEGGTEHFHSVMIARSSSVDGWYEGYPGNPVITHRHLGYHYPIDNAGHADLVDTPDGNWYAVLLASRIIEGQYRNLGRETYLCPVEWERGWPVFSPGTGKIEWEYPADPALLWTEYDPEPEREDFDEDHLAFCWNFWGTPYQDFWKIEDGCLKLKCLARPFVRKLTGFHPGQPDMSRDDGISFLGRRQREIDFTATLKMTFNPQNREAAGFVIMQAVNHQFRLEKIRNEGGCVLRLVQVTTKQKGLPFLPGYEADTTQIILEQKPLNGSEAETAQERGTDSGLVLRLEAKGQNYDFYYGTDEEHLEPFFLHADAKVINPEEVGGMTGTVMGMFATANGEESENAAFFDWFEIKQ